MKKNLTLRTQLSFLMALLLLLQSLGLVLALSISRVFSMLDAEAFRLFNTTTAARVDAFDRDVGNLVTNAARHAAGLGTGLQDVAARHGVAANQLYANSDAYAAAADAAAQDILDMLAQSNITGAFVLLNGSAASPNDADAHAAVYVRNPADATGSLQLEVGPIAVAHAYQVPTSLNWRLDIKLGGEEDARAYYQKPVWAAVQDPGAEIERYGYWSAPRDILGDGQTVVCYTLPLLDGQGVPFGVFGVEISLPGFTQTYLPDTERSYQNSFYAVSAMADNELLLDWYIPSGPIASVYLRQGTSLPLAPAPGGQLYQTQLEGLGQMYCSVTQLTLYSKNSPFYGNAWYLAAFVPVQVLHEGSTDVRTILIASIVITTVVAFAAIMVLAFVFTRRISGLSKYMEGLSPYQDIHFQRTGMREIDDLTRAVEMLNQSVISASKTTSKILELTLLPIGGYEMSSENNGVVLTEFVTRLLGVQPGTQLTLAQWDDCYRKLTEVPAPGYDNTYRFRPAGEDKARWLRILETDTDTGRVGVVLDVSKDIEEHRRLAHELDFDALTHLYNRTAFKREAYALIKDYPGQIGAMVFADLDNLKYVNDTYGHDVGDRLIMQAGAMFGEFSQVGGIVARISGDEFAIYLHGFHSPDEARELIFTQMEANERYALTTPDGTEHRIRFSSGIAWYPVDSDNVTDLLKLSDFAMYEAKHNRKGTTFEFDHESYRKNAYLLENREAINRLLDEGLIRFAFQPIVDLRTGAVYAYEALMRSVQDDFKSPMEILTVAAAQSKLGQLERLAIMTAFRTVDENINALGPIKIFLNSIPSQILSVEDLMLLERRYSHLFATIVMEVTEAENNSPQHLNDKLAFIRRHGMMVAIDDYGSGHSNDLRVLSMNPDIVKVDMEMIQGIHENTDKQKLVENLVSFCHPKGMRLVAEGVEQPEDLAQLVRLNVDYVQGYYTGRPNFEFCPPSDAVVEEIRRLNRG